MVRRVVLGLAIVIVAITAGVRTAAAITLHCCCGAHDADDACGCPDCPADEATEAGDQTSLDRCAAEGEPLIERALPVAVAPPRAVAIDEVPVIEAMAAPRPRVASWTSEPPYEPPRA